MADRCSRDRGSRIMVKEDLDSVRMRTHGIVQNRRAESFIHLAVILEFF